MALKRVWLTYSFGGSWAFLCSYMSCKRSLFVATVIMLVISIKKDPTKACFFRQPNVVFPVVGNPKSVL